MEINHHNVALSKFKELQTSYPTGQYLQSYNKENKMWLAWFVLVVENVEITWYRDWYSMEEEE